MKNKLATLALTIILATSVASAPVNRDDFANLELRLQTAIYSATNIAIFFEFFGESDAAAYFRGRADAFADALAIARSITGTGIFTEQ